MKKIPYNISNYRLIKEEGYVYVDKTHFLEKLENLGDRFLIYLRPRRFGKSLFTSLLYNYYDKNNKDNFQHLFGDTYIGQNKTIGANNYYVLQFDFSGLSSEDLDSLKKSFLIKIKGALYKFTKYYNLDIELDEKAEDAASLLGNFLDKATAVLDGGIYVIIDEYDHFANNFLHNKELFDEMTSSGGFVRAWYEMLKDHTKTVIKRLFITGVSPITLDSLTSGFNIITNITRDLQLHEMMGFNVDEVKNLIDFLELPDSEVAIDVMRKNYNGYLFDEEATTKVFNSNLVLYYVNNYQRYNKPPREIIDNNIRSDYRRLAAMFDLFKDEESKEKIITDIIAGKAVSAELLAVFELGFNFDRDHFLSLIYYLGLLTIDGTAHFSNKLMLRVPNLVIKDVYAQYYYKYLSNKNELKYDTGNVSIAIEDLALHNNIKPLIELMEKSITQMSNRNALDFNEHNLRQMAWIYINISGIYLVKDEYHTGNRYADLMLFSQHEGVSNVIIEFKYLTKDEYSKPNGAKTVEKLKFEAIEQINDYVFTEEMKKLTDLKKFVVIFAFSECVHFEEIE